ncbi:hypothetical protein ACWJJH_16115 [Endozoicomonadaceae bacterium StTr2]
MPIRVCFGIPCHSFTLLQPTSTSCVSDFDSTPKDMYPAYIHRPDDARTEEAKLYWPEQLYSVQLGFCITDKYKAKVKYFRNFLIGIRSKPYVDNYTCRQLYIHSNDGNKFHEFEGLVSSRIIKVTNLGSQSKIIIALNSNDILLVITDDVVPDNACQITTITTSAGCSCIVDASLMWSALATLCNHWIHVYLDEYVSYETYVNTDIAPAYDVLKTTQAKLKSHKADLQDLFTYWSKLEEACLQLFYACLKELSGFGFERKSHTFLYFVLSNPEALAVAPSDPSCSSGISRPDNSLLDTGMQPLPYDETYMTMDCQSHMYSNWGEETVVLESTPTRANLLPITAAIDTEDGFSFRSTKAKSPPIKIPSPVRTFPSSSNTIDYPDSGFIGSDIPIVPPVTDDVDEAQSPVLQPAAFPILKAGTYPVRHISRPGGYSSGRESGMSSIESSWEERAVFHMEDSENVKLQQAQARVDLGKLNNAVKQLALDCEALRVQSRKNDQLRNELTRLKGKLQALQTDAISPKQRIENETATCVEEICAWTKKWNKHNRKRAGKLSFDVRQLYKQ